jgi:hypothetical protein
MRLPWSGVMEHPRSTTPIVDRLALGLACLFRIAYFVAERLPSVPKGGTLTYPGTVEPIISGLILRALDSFLAGLANDRWAVREREAISIFAFRYLSSAFRQAEPPLDAGQIGIEATTIGLVRMGLDPCDGDVA